MDNEFAPQSYYIVQGYIDAKDDRGHSVNGTFISLVTRRDVRFTSVNFDQLEMDKSTSWKDLLPLHEEAQKNENRDPLLIHHEEGLYKFLQTSLILTHVAKNLNAKQAEQAISRFCLDELKLKAVCFVSFTNASEDDMTFFQKKEQTSAQTSPNAEASFPSSQEKKDKQENTESEPQDGGHETESKDLFVRCEPVLDPVGGIAMNELAAGYNVYCRLSADSVIYKLLAKNNPSFDGLITGKVTGIMISDIGTATVSLALSDGVAGVMKLSGKVRVMVVREKEADGSYKGAGSVFRSRMSPLVIPPELIFIAAGIVVAIAAVSVLYYIFQ
ncbi:MAG: hypothetical protein LBS45_03345 [Synergistaceae bacterium]|nr:hypothetical protein [Synergistaceae bacterium]